MTRAFAIVLAASALSSCREVSAPDDNGLRITIAAPRAMHSGDTTSFQITIENHTAVDHAVANYECPSNFVVKNVFGDVASMGSTACFLIYQEKAIPAGATVTFPAYWDTRDLNYYGDPLPPGVYTVEARVHMRPEGVVMTSKPVRLTIVP